MAEETPKMTPLPATENPTVAETTPAEAEGQHQPADLMKSARALAETAQAAVTQQRDKAAEAAKNALDAAKITCKEGVGQYVDKAQDYLHRDAGKEAIDKDKEKEKEKEAPKTTPPPATETTPEAPTATETTPAEAEGEHQPADLMTNAITLAEAAQAAATQQTDKIDKAKVAEAAENVLEAAKSTGKLDDKVGVGQCLDKAQDHLHQMHSGDAGKEETDKDKDKDKEKEKEKEKESTGGGFMKMAQGLFK